MYDDDTLPVEECIQFHAPENDCDGPVEYRFPLSPSGKSFPRCEKHWYERLDLEEELQQRYPITQPDDFDPLYAGESWYEDEGF